MPIQNAKELFAYKKSFALAMQIFEASKGFPREEKYSLTDQIRRSSRSVCANLREAWAKRRYEAYFVSKLIDADGENGETDTWLDFALKCGYLSVETHGHFVSLGEEVGALLGKMIKDPQTFIQKHSNDS